MSYTSNRDGSWQSSDTQEIEKRRRRAGEEKMLVRPAEKGHRSIFQDYLVTRSGETDALTYRVELRSLQQLHNTCSCPDFKKSFLGTCKHIEKVLSWVKPGRKKDSPKVELYISGQDAQPCIVLPEPCPEAVKVFLHKFLDLEGRLRRPLWNSLQVLLRDLENCRPEVKEQFRISAGIEDYIGEMLGKEHLQRVRRRFVGELRQQAGQSGFLRLPLYDYQIEGMLHLAFTGRAMLADEMGLGKTVQALAAAALMRRHFEVKTVLVVAPASLKTEWEEQIRKFTALPCEIVYGSKKTRLQLYRQSKAFFILSNYEQIIRDYEEINQTLQPDLVILDEAQRIKNWRTKTANRIKRLKSRFAFVLTGTPLENRIDELYSLVEFINPGIFGSLFRFNRRFYRFNEEGKVDGVQNLKQLHEEVSEIMLRRRKSEIADQLPERIENNYFVEMNKEQRERYDEYALTVARLYNLAKKRPLNPRESEQLQIALACMRMLCDSCYILDQEIKESPKIDELMLILEELWSSEPGRKVIIFSEWVRMLELVEERLQQRSCAYALHAGHVEQQKRREEINRFKNCPDCLVFLSSDSGGLGLNLQAASVVVNLDLPWNPARLEQRIARAWRKHQKNQVNVINLVSSNSIEHRMLGTLEFKQGLADVVLDALGDFEQFEQSDAKAAFMERLSQIMEGTLPAPQPSPLPKALEPAALLQQELTLDNPGLGSCSVLYDREGDKPPAVLAVGTPKAGEQLLKSLAKTHAGQIQPDRVCLLSPEQYQLLQQLAALGLISINDDKMTRVFEDATRQAPPPPERRLRLKKSRSLQELGERRLRMSRVLCDGDFLQESLPPAKDALLHSALALLLLSGTMPLEQAPEQFTALQLPELKKNCSALSREQLMLLQLALHDCLEEPRLFLQECEGFLQTAAEYINKQALTS